MSRTHFLAFLGGHRIVIPRLQRDYAQGRGNSKVTKIRDEFVKALLSAIRDGGALHLDYIYGVQAADTRHIIDGQQRLTSLYLLHWYLHIQAGDGAKFGKCLFPDETQICRFSYEVRPSAGDFFRFAAKEAAEVPQDFNGQRPSAWIREQRWFNRMRGDPTVEGCLTMLDALHQAFDTLPEEILKDGDRLQRRLERITFTWLSLDEHGLGEEVYIKLNARGLSLTALELFQADLEGAVVGDENGEAILSKLDTEWANFVWGKLIRPDAANYCDAMLTLLGMIAYTATLEREKAAVEPLRPVVEKGRAQCYAETMRVETIKRSSSGLQPFLKQLDRIMTGLKNNGFDDLGPYGNFIDPYSGQARSRRSDGKRQLADWAMTLGYLVFVGRPQGSTREEQCAWVRMLHNLLRPSELSVKTFDDVVSLCRRLADLYPGGGVEAFVVSDDFAKAFEQVPQQMRFGWRAEAERFKAGLLLSACGPEWGSLLQDAELHPRFKGDVHFLFEADPRGGDPSHVGRWTGHDGDGREEFEKVLSAAKELFPEKKAEDREYCLERVLVARSAIGQKPRRVFHVQKTSRGRFYWTLPSGDELLESLSIGARGADERNPQVPARRVITLCLLKDFVKDRQENPGAASLSSFLKGEIARQVERIKAGDAALPWWGQILIEYPVALDYCCGPRELLRDGARPRGRSKGKRRLAVRDEEERLLLLKATQTGAGYDVDMALYVLAEQLHKKGLLKDITEDVRNEISNELGRPGKEPILRIPGISLEVRSKDGMILLGDGDQMNIEDAVGEIQSRLQSK